MNTIKSTWLGWGTLCVAGGGAYYFAKKQINADRASRYNQEREKQERLRRLEASVPFSDGPSSRPKKKKASDHDSNTNGHGAKGDDHAGKPSIEAADTVAPVAHASETPEVRTGSRSKYEAEIPYRSKKGDRFS